jgi:hypothetical protein
VWNSTKSDWRRSSVRNGMPLLIGMAAMLLATVGLILAFVAFGGAGKERGLVIRNETGQPVIARFEHGASLHLAERQEETIGAKRGDYPQMLYVTTERGALLWDVQLQFSDLSHNTFRLVLGPTGLIPTPAQSGATADFGAPPRYARVSSGAG